MEGREREQIAEDDEVWARLAGGEYVRSGRLREGSGAVCSGAGGSRGAFSFVSVAGSGAWERLIGEVSWSEGSGEVGGSSLSCCVWGGWGVDGVVDDGAVAREGGDEIRGKREGAHSGGW